MRYPTGAFALRLVAEVDASALHPRADDRAGIRDLLARAARDPIGEWWRRKAVRRRRCHRHEAPTLRFGLVVHDAFVIAIRVRAAAGCVVATQDGLRRGLGDSVGDAESRPVRS